MMFLHTLIGFILLFVGGWGLPVSLLYEHDVPKARELPRGDDVSSEEILLDVPFVYFDVPYESIYVNSNGFLSFQTEIPDFINIEFPLDYPIIAPFYTNVDTTKAGRITYYQSNDRGILRRATQNVHDSFSDMTDFEATSIFVVTWYAVGYYKEKSDKLNTYQVAISTDGASTFVEFLYPENGLQWIQGSGDESGLPDARAQVGIISTDGSLFTLPGSGTEQVVNLEKWSNMKLNGQFIYRVDGPAVQEPDLNNDNLSLMAQPTKCSQAPTACHVQAKCIDYESGFCCKCRDKYYGNGKFCVSKDAPLRVNGKVTGKINGEHLENLDLQSYIVMTDGRAYTAVSKIPESIGFDIQSLQILGSVIGFLFAKPIRNAYNGYQLTGGVFNHSAKITFSNTSQVIQIKQKYLGLDVFDQLRIEIDIQGELPPLPVDAKIIIDEYQEQYTMTQPGVIQMTGSRIYKYNNAYNEEIEVHYEIDQTFLFDYCKFENNSVGETWKLKVGKNFISYESREQIIRFGLSNKITPLGDSDPCEEGRSQCGENSACVVENDSFRCVCNPGYQNFYNGNQTVCGDLNECQSGLHDCDVNAECFNVVGSYYCKCYPGFEGNGQFCENAHSCNNVQCNENAQCETFNNVATCKCLPGFHGDGQTCTPIVDQSCHVNNNCSPYGLCTINPETNSYYCTCLPGYVGDGYVCELDSGYTGSSNKVPARCLFDTCMCPLGYDLDADRKYCLRPEDKTSSYTESCYTLNNCHRDAQCLYSPSTNSSTCICNAGYQGDGYNCTIISCRETDNCDPHATCTEVDQISKCVCNEGYYGDGYTCLYFSSLCSINDDCPITEECIPAYGYTGICVCREGYTRDSQDQCVAAYGNCGGGICVENAECLLDDELQTHFCQCRDGYVGDGISHCVPKPIGCDQLQCSINARCIEHPENYTSQCLCNDGYYGDGFVCYQERNCNNDPGLCDPNARCIFNDEQKFVCLCIAGYIGNGTTCKERPEVEGDFLLVNQGMVTLKVPTDEAKKVQGKPLQMKNGQISVGLDIDCVEGRFYWSDISGRAIRSATYNGSDKTDFIKIGIGSPEGLAIDWVSRNIYWTDSTKDTIEVANLDTKLRRTLFKTNLVNPRGIAVHPQRGKIFWTDWNRNQPKIEWASADGTNRQIFLTGDAVLLPNSLTIDYDDERLCYADSGTKKIECINIDTKARQTIATNCTYPFGVTITDQHIYWSDWISKKVERAEKYSLKRLAPLPILGFGNKIYQLTAVPNRCPQLTNVCRNHRCADEHICLPNDAGSRSCACAFKSFAPDEVPSCEL